MLMAIFILAANARAQQETLPVEILTKDGAIQAMQKAFDDKFSIYGGTVAGHIYASSITWTDGSISTTASPGATTSNKLISWVSSKTVALWATPTSAATANDDTTPLISEGFKILTATKAVADTTHTLEFRWSLAICEPVDSCTFGVSCVYQDGNTTPLCCKPHDLSVNAAQRVEWSGFCSVAVSALPTSDTSSHYYTLTIGENAGSCISVNGCAARFYGGALESVFNIKELAP